MLKAGSLLPMFVAFSSFALIIWVNPTYFLTEKPEIRSISSGKIPRAVELPMFIIIDWKTTCSWSARSMHHFPFEKKGYQVALHFIGIVKSSIFSFRSVECYAAFEVGNVGFLRGSVLVDTVGRNLANQLRYIKPDVLLKQEMLLRVSGILNQKEWT